MLVLVLVLSWRDHGDLRLLQLLHVELVLALQVLALGVSPLLALGGQREGRVAWKALGKEPRVHLGWHRWLAPVLLLLHLHSSCLLQACVAFREKRDPDGSWVMLDDAPRANDALTHRRKHRNNPGGLGS